jgi:tetratricopeptide (TPR) repeat protein
MAMESQSGWRRIRLAIARFPFTILHEPNRWDFYAEEFPHLSMARASSSRFGLRPETWITLLLAVATIAGYARVLGNDFVNYDDHDYVVDNPHVHAGLTWASLWWDLTTPYFVNWHPLTWISFQLDFSAFRFLAWGYHFTNLVLHVGNTLLLFAVLKRMTAAVWQSAFVAALFALHPLHVESVAWVAERKDVLSTFFGMLTLWAYAGYVERPRVGRYLAVFILFALSLMAKPMLVTWPCVMLLLDFWPLGRLASVSPTRLIVEKLPLLALAAASSALTLWAQRQGGATYSGEVFPLRLENALISYVAYLFQTIWPQGLIPFYPFPDQLFPLWQIAAAGALLIGITAVAFLNRRRRPYLIVGWLWYLGTLVPVIGFVPILGGMARADRFTYIPLIGLFIMLSCGLAELAGRARSLRIAVAGGALVVLALCLALTVVQVGYWSDSLTLWVHTLQVNPDNCLAHNNIGQCLSERGRWDLAGRHFDRALALKADFPQAQVNLGMVLEMRGKTTEALEHYRAATVPGPIAPTAYFHLGHLLARQGNWQEGIECLRTALQLRPEYAEAQQRLGQILAQHGQLDEAVSHFQIALRINPDQAPVAADLGTTLDSLGRHREAVAAFQQAIMLRPTMAKYHSDLAHCLTALGDQMAARREYQKALRLDPKWPQQANQVAWVLATCPEEAARNGALACRLAEQLCEATNRQEPDYLDTLAAAYAEAGRFPDADVAAKEALALFQSQGATEQAAQVEARWRLYQRHEPFRAAPAIKSKWGSPS